MITPAHLRPVPFGLSSSLSCKLGCKSQHSCEVSALRRRCSWLNQTASLGNGKKGRGGPSSKRLLHPWPTRAAGPRCCMPGVGADIGGGAATMYWPRAELPCSGGLSPMYTLSAGMEPAARLPLRHQYASPASGVRASMSCRTWERSALPSQSQNAARVTSASTAAACTQHAGVRRTRRRGTIRA